MSRSIIHQVCRALPLALVLTLPIASTAGAAAVRPGDACEVLLPDDVHRRAAGFEGETHCYRLDLPAPGLWHLDLAAASGAATRARLTVTPADGSSAHPGTVRRSASERLERAPAGVYLLEVSAEDPRQPLPAYRLSSRFAAFDKSETDGELEVDPEPFSGCGQKSETDGELEVDPEPLQALCKDGDDHGDTFACATAVDRSARGQLGNGWGDDVDVFRFELRRWQTLEIATAGGVDAQGELYDGAGQRLDGNDDGGEGGNFRLVRTLGPGTYFVRIQGRASNGAYRLSVDPVAE